MLPSLEELLDSLGFKHWITVICSFFLPFISCIGVILCSLSLFIFTRPRFINPIFSYYRLLCLVYIIHLLHGIPYGLLFSPRYFPRVINTYLSGLYKIYYACVSLFLFQVESVLQMAILLKRMKLISPFVERHFSASPRAVSHVIISACFLINFPVLFSLEIKSFGQYYDELNNGQNVTLYSFQSSDFSLTPLGQIVFGVIVFFLNLFMTLAIGVALNIVSFVKFKAYIRQRQRQEINNGNELEMTSIHNRLTTRREVEQYYERENVKHHVEKNMFYMALALCSISILSHVLLMIVYVYYFIFYSFSASIHVSVISFALLTLEPVLAIFVFYPFNKMFRDEFEKLFRCKNIEQDQELAASIA